MSALLSLQNICAGYGGRPVVRDVCLDIRAGELCALLGLNGSGKSTLLKALCGLVPVTGGHVLVDGVDCTRLSERARARRLSYIPQRHSALPGVTVLDVVLMGRNPHLGLLQGVGKSDRQAALALLDALGLSACAADDFACLSEGRKQKVILARALLQDARVMLLDEPDSAMDFPNRHDALAMIRQLVRDTQKAGLITMHDPNFALAYCDRIFLLHEGRTVGALDVKGADREAIRACLSRIYGDIDIIPHSGGYLMARPAPPR